MKKFNLSTTMILLGMFIMSACGGGGGSDDPANPGDDHDDIITISEIQGVTVPVVGAIPVRKITETEQYTGIVSWTPSDVTFGNKIYTATITLTAKEGYTLTGVEDNFFTVSGTSTAATNSADSAVVKAEFLKADWPKYNLRDTGPAGGWIFYINPNAEKDGWKYLECAPKSTEFENKVWGGESLILKGADGYAIGTGKQNTIDIINAFGDAEPYHNRPDYAAKLCSDLVFGGYEDWFLPSEKEMEEVKKNLYLMNYGDFELEKYWTSTDFSSSDFPGIAKYYDFIDNYGNASFTETEYMVRAIRSF